VEEKLRDPGEGGEARPLMTEPAVTVAGGVVASREVVVIQHRNSGREVHERAKDCAEGVPEVEDTEVLADVDVTAR
jgi:hypothetical protein